MDKTPAASPAPYRNERTLGSFGAGGLVNPYLPVDLAVGSDGRLFVIDRGHSVMNGCAAGDSSSDANAAKELRVKIWAMDDDKLGEFGPVGSGEGQFLWPTAVAIDARDRIYVSDEARHDVQVFDASGALLASWGTFGAGPGQLNRPCGLAILPGGDVLVADCLNHRIQRFTPDGRHVAIWGERGAGPGQLDQPWGLTVDGEGNVYVADWANDRVQKFSGEGRHVATFGSSGSGADQLKRPSSVAVDADGRVYVADLGNNRVQVFTRDGAHFATLLGDGSLSKRAVAYYQSRGSEVWDVQAPEHRRERSFRAPTAVKIDREGRLLVVDTLRNRIQVYEKIDLASAADASGWRATDWLVREHASAWLERAGLADHAKKLRELPELRSEVDAASAMPLVAAAGDAAADAAVHAPVSEARRAAWDQARAAAWPAMRSAASEALASTARDAAGAAAWAAS